MKPPFARILEQTTIAAINQATKSTWETAQAAWFKRKTLLGRVGILEERMQKMEDRCKQSPAATAGS